MYLKTKKIDMYVDDFSHW